jgi:hypothetical protein
VRIWVLYAVAQSRTAVVFHMVVWRRQCKGLRGRTFNLCDLSESNVFQLKMLLRSRGTQFHMISLDACKVFFILLTSSQQHRIMYTANGSSLVFILNFNGVCKCSFKPQHTAMLACHHPHDMSGTRAFHDVRC